MSMLTYPQLGSGALSQYPVRKTRRVRTVVNEAADGSTVRLADPAGETTEWQLEYAEISDDEAAALEQFFTAAEGTLNGFTFPDPTANLLGWSEQLDNRAWQADPQLSVAGGVDDPAGGTAAWRLSNSGGAAQGIWQTLQAPGGYTYCLSVYVRAAAPTAVQLWIGSQTAERVVSSGWGRIVAGGGGAGGCGVAAVRDRSASGDDGGGVRATGGGTGRRERVPGEHARRRLPGRPSSRRRFQGHAHRIQSQFMHGEHHSCQPSMKLKEQAVTDTPLLVFDCALPDGRTEHWSTHAVTVAGVTYEARVMSHNVFEMQTASDQGVDGIPRISLVLAQRGLALFGDRAGDGVEGRAADGELPVLRPAQRRAGDGSDGAVPGHLQSAGRDPGGDVPDHGDEPDEPAAAAAAAGAHPAAVPVGVSGARRSSATEAIDGGANGKYSRYYRCGYSAE